MTGRNDADKNERSHVVVRAMSVTKVLYEIVTEKLGTMADEYLRFPRDVESLVAVGFDLPVRHLPRLSLRAKAEYLCILRGDRELREQNIVDRDLLGLLHVGPPANMIFVKQDLSPQIRNYVIAHELGHYLNDVFVARQLWLNSLPEQKEAIMLAFAWQRVDPWLELRALLRGLPQRPCSITGRGQHLFPATRARELSANAIARELLAPWEQVCELFRCCSYAEALACLCRDYGLPKRVAGAYYDECQRVFSPPPDLLDRLFAPVLQQQYAVEPDDQ